MKGTRYAVFSELLYHIPNPIRYDPEPRLQLVIPKDLMTTLLTELHDNVVTWV